MRRLLCLLGMHRRSRGKARYEAQLLVSACRHCGRDMYKGGYGKWRVQAHVVERGLRTTTGLAR